MNTVISRAQPHIVLIVKVHENAWIGLMLKFFKTALFWREADEIYHPLPPF